MAVYQTKAVLVPNSIANLSFVITGGEGGIRTLGRGIPYTHFPGVLLRPLGHLTILGLYCVECVILLKVRSVLSDLANTTRAQKLAPRWHLKKSILP